jgi:O-antigen ligase
MNYKKLSVVLTTIFSIFYLIVPIVPDVQIVRPKLFVVEILVFVALTTFLFFVILEGKFCYRDTKIFVVVILLCLYIIFQYIFSLDKALSFMELKRWMLSFVGLFLISVIDYKYHKWLIFSWILGSGIAILYGYLQHTGGFWFIEVPKMSRVMSMFGNPIFFAVHITNFFPVLFGTILVSYKKNSFIKNFFLVSLLILSLVTLYYTQTRAAFVGLAVSVCVFIFLSIKSNKKYWYLLMFLVTVFIFIILTKKIWFRQQAHLLIWRDTIKMWSTKPFFGIGLGRFHTEFVNFASQELRTIWPQGNFIINDAHNEYLQILSETGIVGLMLFFTILATFFYYVTKEISKPYFFEFKKMKVTKDNKDKNLVLKNVNYDNNENIKNLQDKKYLVYALLTSIIAVFVQNIFSVDMRFIISAVYFFLTIGLVCGTVFELKFYEIKFLNNKQTKIVLTILTSIFLGLVSIDFSHQKLSFINCVHITKNGIKFFVEDSGSGILQNVLRPYIAQQKLKQEPDFFDEKILDKEKTLQELLELQKKFPQKSIIYEKIAWIYAKEKQFDKAIENYLIAIKYNPLSFGAYNNLGNIMFLLGRKQDAIKAYQRSIEINPNQVDARLNLGILYYYEGQLNLASDQFNKVLELDPKNEKAIIMLKKMRE